MFEVFGYNVIEAASAFEAQTVWEKERQRINLLLTDVGMPQLKGCELAENLLREEANLPVLFTSANFVAPQLLKKFVFGNTDFMEKPVTLESISSKIRVILKQSR